MCSCSMKLNGFWSMIQKYMCLYSVICRNISARHVGIVNTDFLNLFNTAAMLQHDV
jgi:hypothetical protein